MRCVRVRTSSLPVIGVSYRAVHTDPTELPIQLRDLPSMRVARLAYCGAPEAIGRAFEQATRFAIDEGVGPCGPLIGCYPSLAAAPDSIQAEVLVPLTRLPDDAPEGIELLRLAGFHSVCLLYRGPMDPGFRKVHLELFAWMDSRGIPRDGTRHQHAYVAGTDPESDWTIEIRVPVRAGRRPLRAL